MDPVDPDPQGCSQPTFLTYFTYLTYPTYLTYLPNLFKTPGTRVSDPHCFNADPDMDPDPAFFIIADPDSGSGSRV